GLSWILGWCTSYAATAYSGSVSATCALQYSRGGLIFSCRNWPYSTLSIDVVRVGRARIRSAPTCFWREPRFFLLARAMLRGIKSAVLRDSEVHHGITTARS